MFVDSEHSGFRHPHAPNLPRCTVLDARIASIVPHGWALGFRCESRIPIDRADGMKSAYRYNNCSRSVLSRPKIQLRTQF